MKITLTGATIAIKYNCYLTGIFDFVGQGNAVGNAILRTKM